METLLLLISLTFSLFILLNPVGNVPVFIAILKKLPAKRQRKIILRESIIALIVIILFNFVGDLVLKLFNVSEDTVSIAGGVILFLIALKMVFPTTKTIEFAGGELKEPFIVPLAVPLIAGPAVLAAIILYAHQMPYDWIVIGAILLAWVASTIILLASSFLKKILGDKGLVACERLMGLLLILVSIQKLLNGITSFVHTVHGQL